jgi:hypothetical protein
MSLFFQALKKWGDLKIYGDLGGVDAFMRDFERKKLKNVDLFVTDHKNESLGSVVKSKDYNGGDIDNIGTSKDNTASDIISGHKKSKINLYDENDVKPFNGKNIETNFPRIKKHINDESLIAAIEYCLEKGDFKICSIDENYIELVTMREKNIFLKAEAITLVYKLKGQVEERFGVRANITYDLFHVKMYLRKKKDK